MTPSLLHRLDVRDRALFVRWAIAGTPSRSCHLWRGLTHLVGDDRDGLGLVEEQAPAAPAARQLGRLEQQ